MSSRLLLLCLWVAIACVGGSVSSAPSAAGASPRGLSVLLVGNSYTRFNVMPTLVQRIAESVPDGPRLRVDSVAHAGYTLRMHWLHSETRQRIRRRSYTHVVLQGHSLAPIERADEFVEYAGQLKRVIDASRAHTVLYETWARRGDAAFYRERPDVESPHAMQSLVGNAYAQLAGSLDAVVAPVGQAFAQTDVEAPELALHRGDGSHPTVLGSYLAALVLYGTVTENNPEQVEYRPWPVTRSEARKVRVLASEVLARRMRDTIAAADAPPGAAAAADPLTTAVVPADANSEITHEVTD